MGKPGYQRKKEHKERHNLQRLDVLLPAEVKDRLQSMANCHGLKIVKMIEKLVMQAGESDAERLLRQAGGDHKAALALLKTEALAAHPDFRMSPSKKGESPEDTERFRPYRLMRDGLYNIQKKLRKAAQKKP